jgi:hypothetical protein
MTAFRQERTTMQRENTISAARGCIERAIELLDEAGETPATFHLQFALDILTDAPVLTTVEEVEAVMEAQRRAPKQPTGAASLFQK